jgi:hypothetical protein
MTFLVTVACRSSSADLASAKGCQDHTPSSSALAHSSRTPLRPSHPAPNIRDDREAPSGARDAEDNHIFTKNRSEIFEAIDRAGETA